MRTRKEIINRLRYLNAKLGEIYKYHKKGPFKTSYPEDGYAAMDVADIDGETTALSWMLNDDSRVFKGLPNLLNIPIIRKMQFRMEQLNNDIKKADGNK